MTSFMDPFSDQYMRMNHRITKVSNMLFPMASQASYREVWEQTCLDKWLDDPTQTPDVQARRRTPNYKKTYETRPPKFY